MPGTPLTRRWRVMLSALLCAALLGWSLHAGDTPTGDAATRHAAAEAHIMKDIGFLAGDMCEGRGIHTHGIHIAADFIAANFKAYGLKPGGTDGYFQPFDVGTRGSVGLGSGNQLSLKGADNKSTALTMGVDFVTLSGGASGGVSGEIVFAGYGIESSEPAYNDYEGIDVAGKVVLLLRNAPRYKTEDLQPNFHDVKHPDIALVGKVGSAIAKKAAAVLLVNDAATAGERDALMRFNQPVAPTGQVLAVPVMHVKRAVADQMLAPLGKTLKELEEQIDKEFKPLSQAIKNSNVELQTNITRSTTKCKNVIGVLEGSGPLADETIVIGAHYDHLGYGTFGSLSRGQHSIHYGADDNCSGTVCVLELARRFGQMKGREGRRMVFILFSAEESGLLGSAHYCRQPTFPLDKTVAMVNLDMVGRYREEVKLQVMGVTTAKDQYFDKIINEANAAVGMKLELSGGGQFFGASDHYSFYMKDIPVIFLFTGMHPEYHTPADQVPTINIQGIRQCADLVEGILLKLTTLEQKPAFVKVQTTPRIQSTGPRLGIMPSYEDEKDGMMIESVTENGLAAKAGLKKGDRVIEISGKPVKNVTGYMNVMRGFKKGDKLEIIVLRNGDKVKIELTIE